MTPGPKEMTALAAEAISGVRIMDNAGAFKVYEGEPWLDRIRNIDLDALRTAAAPASGVEQMREALEKICDEIEKLYHHAKSAYDLPHDGGVYGRSDDGNHWHCPYRPSEIAEYVRSKIDELSALPIPPAAGLDREAVAEMAKELTTKYGNPNGSLYEQGVQDHGHRIYHAILALQAAPSTNPIERDEARFRYLTNDGPARLPEGYEAPLEIKSSYEMAMDYKNGTAPSTKTDGER